MKLSTITTTTALFSADEIKAAALSLARKQAGLADDAALASSTVTIQADGTVQVDMVAAAPAAPASAETAPKVDANAPTAPATPAAPAVGGSVPGFGR